MIAMEVKDLNTEYVVHPIYDVPEEKRTGEGLGFIAMSPSVKISLIALRAYLVLMTLMLGYHVLDLSGVLGHHISK